MRDKHIKLTRRRPSDGQPPTRRGAWWRRLTAVAALTMLASAVAVVGTESVAQAMPVNCTTVNGGTYAESMCTSGVGEHRVVMIQTIGWIGTMRINSIVSGFPVITQNDPPVRTSQGQLYSGVYTINASFTPNLGAAIPRTQTAQATIGVIINNDRAYPTPPVFIRFT